MTDSRLVILTALVVLGTIVGNGAFLWMLFHAVRRRRFEWVLVVFACPPIGLAQSTEVMDGSKLPIRLFLLGWVLVAAGIMLLPP